jgi:hypothetical protein
LGGERVRGGGGQYRDYGEEMRKWGHVRTG